MNTDVAWVDSADTVADAMQLAAAESRRSNLLPLGMPSYVILLCYR